MVKWQTADGKQAQNVSYLAVAFLLNLVLSEQKIRQIPNSLLYFLVDKNTPIFYTKLT
jgi:hypothetical protein